LSGFFIAAILRVQKSIKSFPCKLPTFNQLQIIVKKPLKKGIPNFGKLENLATFAPALNKCIAH